MSPLALARAVNLLTQAAASSRPAGECVIRPAGARPRDRWQRPWAREASHCQSQQNKMRWETDSDLGSLKKCWCCFFILCAEGRHRQINGLSPVCAKRSPLGVNPEKGQRAQSWRNVLRAEKCSGVHCATKQTANQRKLKEGRVWNEIQYGQSMPPLSLSNLHSELFLTPAEDTDSLCLHSEP